MLTPQEKFMAVVSNMPLKKADAIVILEGDNLHRVSYAAKLYSYGEAPFVVISGGIDNATYHSIPAAQMKPELIALGVPEEAIILEEKSQHTRGQAEEVVALATERGWKRILLVASHYHQYRAFLTFLPVLIERGLERKIEIINAPVRGLSWFTPDGDQDTRFDLLEGEFERIEKYKANGHIASYEDALAYLEWLESR